jgi:hypothetical protein
MLDNFRLLCSPDGATTFLHISANFYINYSNVEEEPFRTETQFILIFELLKNFKPAEAGEQLELESISLCFRNIQCPFHEDPHSKSNDYFFADKLKFYRTHPDQSAFEHNFGELEGEEEEGGSSEENSEDYVNGYKKIKGYKHSCYYVNSESML